MTNDFPVVIGIDLDAEAIWLGRKPENAQRPVLLSHGTYPAIATHDAAMIAAARAHAAQHHIRPEQFEFQMLYGIRRDLQAQLTAAGFRVRVYVPFGREWFPYFMRRLGERPANVGFVMRAVMAER